jgi:hypothetical protein
LRDLDLQRMRADANLGSPEGDVGERGDAASTAKEQENRRAFMSRRSNNRRSAPMVTHEEQCDDTPPACRCASRGRLRGPRPWRRRPASPRRRAAAQARRAQASRPTYNLTGYPPAVRDGYIDGCESAKQAAYARKDAKRMTSDAQYSMGWNDGLLILRQEVMFPHVVPCDEGRVLHDQSAARIHAAIASRISGHLADRRLEAIGMCGCAARIRSRIAAGPASGARPGP